MSSNVAASASADSEHYTLRLCVVNHDFIITNPLLVPKVQQGMLVDDFLKAVLAEYPDTFSRGTAVLYYLPGGFMFPVRQTKKVESEGWLEISSDQIFTRNGEDLEGDPDRMLWIEIPDNSARKVFYVIKNPGKGMLSRFLSSLQLLISVDSYPKLWCVKVLRSHAYQPSNLLFPSFPPRTLFPSLTSH